MRQSGPGPQGCAAGSGRTTCPRAWILLIRPPCSRPPPTPSRTHAPCKGCLSARCTRAGERPSCRRPRESQYTQARSKAGQQDKFGSHCIHSITLAAARSRSRTFQTLQHPWKLEDVLCRGWPGRPHGSVSGLLPADVTQLTLGRVCGQAFHQQIFPKKGSGSL